MKGLVKTVSVATAVIIWDSVCFTLTLNFPEEREINNHLGLTGFWVQDTLPLP